MKKRLVLSLTAFAAFAQSDTASLSGAITDPGAAAVAGAKITLKNVATQNQRTALSDIQGLYRFSLLIPRNYCAGGRAGPNLAQRGRRPHAVGRFHCYQIEFGTLAPNQLPGRAICARSIPASNCGRHAKAACAPAFWEAHPGSMGVSSATRTMHATGCRGGITPVKS
jgi:hypothetical protein